MSSVIKKSSTPMAKVVVIGSGRFGSAVAQGLRASFVKQSNGSLIPVSLVHVSARRFVSLSISDMADKLSGVSYVVYCGTKLQDYASRLADAMKEAQFQNNGMESTHTLEFIDFSNPDPVTEADDVAGAVTLWKELNSDGVGPEHWKLWKITEVGSLDVCDAENSSSDAFVYGNGISNGEVPQLMMPGIVWKSAPTAKHDLIGEAHNRMMERAGIDRWWDAAIMGFAMFCFTGTYAIVRYHENINGSEPSSNILMYLLDKGYCWTGLWMMVISPFAGNLLALWNLYEKFGSLSFLHKIVTLGASIIMIIPTAFLSITWFLWVVMRNIWFAWTRGGVDRMYESQHADPSRPKEGNFWKSCLIDMVTLKGETGNVGFVYVLIHSFIGLVVADVGYKGYWFGPNGRMLWRFELSMMTGCVSTAVLWCVAMRSLFGKASWIRLKPVYQYLSPFGIWMGTLHVMAFGAKGWTKLFKKKYHNGQMSITFVSSMFPAGILLAHHLMATFGTKKQVSDTHLWKNSMINIATQDFVQLTRRLQVSGGGYSVGQTAEDHMHRSGVATSTYASRPAGKNDEVSIRSFVSEESC